MPIQATDGQLYGATQGGGANGYGTIFKVTTQGTLTTVLQFYSQTTCADGQSPYAGMVQTADENFCGTTWSGPHF